MGSTQANNWIEPISSSVGWNIAQSLGGRLWQVLLVMLLRRDPTVMRAKRQDAVTTAGAQSVEGKRLIEP
jgi:hypothetical protein